MEKTLKLKNPIMINGAEVSEMTYDSNEIDGLLFATAEAKKKAAVGMKDSLAAAPEFDVALHLYLGFAAIIALNTKYAFEDLARIKGSDTVEVMNIGRNFIYRSEEAQPENASAEPTEITPESTTRAPQNSKKSE